MKQENIFWQIEEAVPAFKKTKKRRAGTLRLSPNTASAIEKLKRATIGGLAAKIRQDGVASVLAGHFRVHVEIDEDVDGFALE